MSLTDLAVWYTLNMGTIEKTEKIVQWPAHEKSPSERGSSEARASDAVIHGAGGFLLGRWLTAG